MQLRSRPTLGPSVSDAMAFHRIVLQSLDFQLYCRLCQPHCCSPRRSCSDAGPPMPLATRGSIVSRQLPLCSTATSRLYRPCRSPQSLHSRFYSCRFTFYVALPAALHSFFLLLTFRDTSFVSSRLRGCHPAALQSIPRPAPCERKQLPNRFQRL